MCLGHSWKIRRWPRLSNASKSGIQSMIRYFALCVVSWWTVLASRAISIHLAGLLNASTNGSMRHDGHLIRRQRQRSDTSSQSGCQSLLTGSGSGVRNGVAFNQEWKSLRLRSPYLQLGRPRWNFQRHGNVNTCRQSVSYLEACSDGTWHFDSRNRSSCLDAALICQFDRLRPQM